MKRRSALAGIATLASGGAVISSGAFSEITATRNAEVAVTSENDAYLALSELDSVEYPNADIAQNTGSGNTIELSFDNTLEDGDGDGPNTDAVLTFDDVFEVTNNGSQEVYFWAEFPDTNIYNQMAFYPNGDQDDFLTKENPELLTPNNPVRIGVQIDTADIGEDTVGITINADAEDPRS